MKSILQGIAPSVAVAGALSLLSASPHAAAQELHYPIKPIRVIVGVSPGGGTDISARLYGQQLTAMLGQSLVIDNRPGATGLIGMEIAKNSRPDGYTLQIISAGQLMAGSLTPNLPFDITKDFAPISQLTSTPMILVVHPSVPARNLTEFTRLAGVQKDRLNYASGGTLGVQHLATELFAHEAKITLNHVPYKGSGPGIVDLIAGNVQLTMTGVAPVLPFVRAGKLRALAITGQKRAPVLPEVPLFSEYGLPGVVVDGWHGLLAPAHTPRPVIDKLSASVMQAARIPAVRAALADDGAVPIGSSVSEFTTFFNDERLRWIRVAREAHLIPQ